MTRNANSGSTMTRAFTSGGNPRVKGSSYLCAKTDRNLLRPSNVTWGVPVVSWRVFQEDGFPGVWSVARIDAEGSVSYPRNRWRGISCIDAQVIVAELSSAYALGMADMALATVFNEGLGD